MADYNSDRTGSNIDAVLDKADNLTQVAVGVGGNVGIGTASPSAKLASVGFSGTTLIQALGSDSNGYSDVEIKSTGTTGSSRLFFSDTAGQSGFVKYVHSDNSLQFGTNGSERARIDSSGNLLVGTTNSLPYASSTETGVSILANGTITNSTSATSAIFNTLNDGTITQFRKDGATVGSVGTASGAAYLAMGTKGITTNATHNIVGCTSAGTPQSSFLNLGSATYPFSDLYLSGGVYLGGTGAANKLDDYETGTWTPTGYTGGTVLAPTYTKVGNLVTVSVYFYNGTFDGSTIGGLPFAVTTNKFEAVSLANYDATNVNNAFASSQTVINFKNGSSDVTPNASKMMLKVTYQTSA